MGSVDRAPTPDPQKLDKPRRDQRDVPPPPPPPPPPSAAPPPSAPPAPERPGDAPDARETARQNRGRTRRGGASAMAGAFDTLAEKTAQQDPKGLFALREEPAVTAVEQDRYERASARQEAKRREDREAREAREARERASQDKAIRGCEQAERDARERTAREQREREARQQRERQESGRGTTTSKPGQRLLDLAKQHEARQPKPLDAREAIKSVQTGDGRRDQNVTHDLLRQVMASKPYANRVPEVVDFVRAGFSALYPGNVPRDGGDDTLIGGGGDDVLIGGGEDTLTGGGADTLTGNVPTYRGEDRRVGPAPAAPDPFDVAGRYEWLEQNLPQDVRDQQSPEEAEQAIDQGIQRINRDVAERVAELGYLPGGLGNWLLDGINNRDGETGLRAAGLVQEIKDKAGDDQELLFDHWVQVADAIRERQEANPDADPDAIVSGARWSVGVRNAIAWAGRGMRDKAADLAESAEDVLSDLDAAAANDVAKLWSGLVELREDLNDDAVKTAVNATYGLVAMKLGAPWTGMLDKAKELDDLRKDQLAIDPERPRSPLADPTKEALKDAAKEVADEFEKRTGSRSFRAAKKAGTGVAVVVETLDSAGELYQRATEDGHTHQDASRIARSGTAMRMGSELAADAAIIADIGATRVGTLPDSHFEAIEEATAYGLYQAMRAISGEESLPVLDEAYKYVSEAVKKSD